MTTKAAGKPGEIGRVAFEARRRLTLSSMARAPKAHVAIVLGTAAAFAVTRAVTWPHESAAWWAGAVRASGLAAMGAVTACVVLAALAWRKRPTPLDAARKLDDVLALEEVVASGYAFERDARDDEAALLARAHARRAIDGIDLKARLHEPLVAGSRSKYAKYTLIGLVAALVVGAFDDALLQRVRHPISERETASADSLTRLSEEAERALAREGAKTDPKAAAVAEAAKRAAEAARRGDRKRAFEALEEMRAAARALAADEQKRAKALRSVRDELDAKPSGSEQERKAASASEALRRMSEAAAAAKGSSDEAEREKLREMAQRLARAEGAARAAAEASAREARAGETADPRWSRAAEALREAREAAERGDREGMKRALERAEREIRNLENSRSAAGERALSKLSRGASSLDRSMRSSMSGEKKGGAKSGDKGGDKGGDKSGQAGGRDNASGGGDDGEGEGEGEGEGKQGSDKGSVAKGGGSGRSGKEANGAPGTGGGEGERNDGAGTAGDRRIVATGNLQARGDIREGERAVSAIAGMGRGDDARAYHDVFPSYASAVEDGLKDELVPAARRTVVRRYFSAIRPGNEEKGTE